MSTRFGTLCAAFQYNAALAPDAVALRTPGDRQTLTWRQYAARVRAVAAGLAGLGVRHGDTIALMMANRTEFYPLEVGAQHLGATSFSVYNTLSAEQLAYVLDNAGARVVVCEPQHVPRLRASGAKLDHIVCLDEAPAHAMSVSDLLACATPDFDFEATWRAVRPEDVATLIYTSGTTGDPKGVETTHANLMFECYAVAEVLDIEFGDTITSYMPSAHIADRLTSLYFQEVFGTQITCVADAKEIGSALADLHPTIWGAVPRVWEKLKAGIEYAVANEPDETRRAAMRWALSVAAERSHHLLDGRPLPENAAAEWARADDLVLSALRAKIGLDQVRWAISGAAPIPRQTLGFFAGLGIPIAEIWGMSELTCLCSVSHPRDARLGTVGRLLPGMEAKRADDGELLVRGPLVMKGYRGEPEKTAEAVDDDGWLSTGDVITIDAEGFLSVVDRKKELIINASGKNMSPANIENAVKAATPLIGAMAAVGDGKPYNTALIVLDAETVGPYAAQSGRTDVSPAALATDEHVVAQIAAGIAAGNATLSRVEQIRRFRILPTFWEPGGDELTPTMKLKRRVIAEKYAEEIAALYAQERPAHVHEPA
ncbi:fatty acid--CoA ligase FadD11 [Nocardia aurantiaca]|uniref:Acyl-CoA synthetase n=1 Tax=Nocardia aurantiaca TaxID=2675850 RepID=A0A6I3KXN0_9NOCA|nr:fatty acid--CoA ligase FadD11 [Nocardia aurantiaca]MTE12844.1 AMP-binding protein [Nocardia aurantiaca]